MAKIQNLVGKKFGRLTVIKRADDYISPSSKRKPQWLCKCECGNYVNVLASNLKSGNTVSCGCFNKEKASTMFKTHDLSHTRLYRTWADMKTRCYNPNNNHYKYYGARGITVCDEWLDNFQNFYNWAMANSYKDNLTIDRINNNKGYSPENCRWVDRKTQNRNRRCNVNITLNGETLTLVEWCEILNLNYKTVHTRINKYHLPIGKALNVR